MPKSKFGYKYNLVGDKREKECESFKSFLRLRGAEELPKHIDLSNKFNPVIDQKTLGSCSACSLGSILEMLYGKPFVSSRLYIYYNGRDIAGTVADDSGCTLEDQVENVQKNGMCNIDKWPYDISKFTEKPPEECYIEGKKYLAYKCYRADEFSEWKQALSMGLPIYFGVTVTDLFEQAATDGGVIPDDVAKGQPLGGHALVITGYDIEEKTSCVITKIFNKIIGKDTDTETYYTFLNSWGTDDGNGNVIGLKNKPGYFRISETALKSILMDSWVITLEK